MKKENSINSFGSPRANLILGIICFLLCTFDAILIISFPEARKTAPLTMLGFGFIISFIVGIICTFNALKAYKNKKKAEEFIEYIFS